MMLNFTVDDLSSVLARSAATGVHVLKYDDSNPIRDFAWILDPDGTKIERWQPKQDTR
ncbi:hypothetical protein NFI95_02420 [Acetobacteraceae bacterium KSS8]|uniref:VOC domain-containing protein n=1 Tax=Endosaccharibacter trunci TaxID=2812733 RepID=A0ABT1W371_9PROT|nr:hypothetical protein [Acetobacteraceae bacterium KSS8]